MAYHVDRAALAGRIQGFGNVNPPPLEEPRGTDLAKRVVGRFSDMIGEEVMLTVDDFREKGAVGAVKDAVADAGDILVDGVSGIIGWIRGEPAPEEESPAGEDATKALSNGPNGAAYGISQASPTGGINAVWVMPEDADPQAMAQLMSQGGGMAAQQHDPRVPKNIQPYQPPPKHGFPASPMHGANLYSGCGPPIAPYQPAPAGPSGYGRAPMPYTGQASLPQQPGRWGPGGYQPGPAGYQPGAASSASGGGGVSSGAKSLVERISTGEVLVGPEVAKRLVSQCNAAKVTAKQLGEIVCERCRRLYLGLDGGDPKEADASLTRVLELVDVLAQQGAAFTNEAVKEIKDGVAEELLSLRSSAVHKDTADPILRRLGFGGGAAAPAPGADLLMDAAAAPAKAVEADLLGGGGDTQADLASVLSAPAAASASLDPLLAGPSSLAPAGGTAALLAGLDLGSAAVSAPARAVAIGSVPAMRGAPMMAGMAALDSFAKVDAKKKNVDNFDFVGAEMSKAGNKA